MRKRFKQSRVCSSDNYVLSKKACVKCFGELMPITVEEAERIGTSVTVIWI